jgi:hypothetical protein
MNKLFRFLGFVWLFPMAITVWILYVLPLWASGQIKYDGVLDFLIVKFVLVNKSNWYCRLWKNFAGWSGPCVVIYRTYYKCNTPKTLIHEYRHCQQQFIFGPTHYPLYALIFLGIWAFTIKDPYKDHPFEIDARKYSEL